MTSTIVGTLVEDQLGHARSERGAWSTRPEDYRRVQDPRIPITAEHGGDVVGQVLHLERGRDTITCVAEVDMLPAVPVVVAGKTVYVEKELYFSSELLRADDDTVLLRSVALTAWPARINASPVRWYSGEISRRSSWLPTTFDKELLERASEARLTRHGRPIVVAGDQPRRPVTPATRGWIEHRAATAVDVHVSRRELDMIVVPAETPTVIHERGGAYVETVAHGAFDGAQADPERIPTNLHHDRTKIIGKAIRLDPWAELGLEGTVRLSRVSAADEALELISDGLLAVSAGFTIDPRPGSEKWGHGRSERRVVRGVLHHISLVDEAAYADARITAVRRGQALLAG